MYWHDGLLGVMHMQCGFYFLALESEKTIRKKLLSNWKSCMHYKRYSWYVYTYYDKSNLLGNSH